MARDRLAAIRARQALNDISATPSAPQQSSALASGPGGSYVAGAPPDFNPYGASNDGGGGYSYEGRPSREDVRLPEPGWQSSEYSMAGGSGHNRSYSAGQSGSRSLTPIRGGHSRSSSTGSRRYVDSLPDPNEYPVPPIPNNVIRSGSQDFTTPPLAGRIHQFPSSPEEAPPQDFNPNDASSQYAMSYRDQYDTPPQQARHETQYVPTNPRQTRQRSFSGGPPPSGARKISIPFFPVPPLANPEQDPYAFAEKASTVDLVEREEYERRNSEPKRRGTTVSKGQVPFEEMGEFFQEIGDLQQAIREANSSIQAIGDLHNRSLAMASAEDAQAIAINDHLNEKATAARAVFASLKTRLRVLEQGNANLTAMIPLGQSLYNLSLSEVHTREQQVGALKVRFKETIQRYAEVERDNRAKQRAKLERQIKVANPNLTQVEIGQVVKQAEGGDGAMFTQAFSVDGYHSQAARGALREAQHRAAELARIELTLIELAQLFSDMAILVQSQDVAIVKIEQNAVETAGDVEKGLGNVKQAVVHARNARKYRWWCFWICFIIIAIVLIVVCVEVIKPILDDRERNNNNDNNTPAPAPAATPAAAAVDTASSLASLPSSSAATAEPVAQTTSS
ncbi:hypothetical protein JCM11641_004922 [Rhodosporidiobolus odoratus]